MTRYLMMGDKGIKVDFGNEIDLEISRKVAKLRQAIKGRIGGVTEMVSAWSSLGVYYDPMVIDTENLIREIKVIEEVLDEVEIPQLDSKVVEIPTAYGGKYGPDLEFVAQYHGLSPEDVIQSHSGQDYYIFQLGFSPGFPYIQTPRNLVTPKKPDPRTRVDAGSVWIGDKVGGIYTIETPGGTQLIGRTPLRLYDPRWDNPVILRPGDYLRFIPITEEEFEKIIQAVEAGTYQVIKHDMK